MTTSQELHDRITGQNLPKRFLANVERNGDVEVVNWKNSSGEWVSKTLSEIADDTARLVTSLKDLGVGKGDRVVMMIRNRQEFHAIDLAVLFCGATPVSIYNSSAPDQIQYLINDCGAKFAILEDDVFLQRFQAVRNKIPTIEHIALIEADGAGDDIVKYSDMIAAEPADLAAEAESSELSDIATMIYTSGTTGPPKGVTLSHRNIAWTLESVGQSMREQTDIDDFAGKRHVSYLPMAHVMERLLGHYYMVDFATKVYCCPDTGQMPAVVRETKPNVFIGVPRVWEKMYAGVNAAISADPEKEKQFNDGVAAAIPIMAKMTNGTATDEEIATWNFLDEVGFKAVRGLIGLDEVEIGISGAAPIPADILEWFRAIGVPLSEGYGMSETTAVLSWSAAAKPGYVGRAATGVEMKIAEDGEVLARGGNMFEGYLGLPDKTAEAIIAQVSRLPHANVTLIPFHLESQDDAAVPLSALTNVKRRGGRGEGRGPEVPGPLPDAEGAGHRIAVAGCTPIGEARWRQQVRISGRVRSVRVAAQNDAPTLELVIADGTGAMSVVFLGRRDIAGISIDTQLVVEGTVGIHKTRMAIFNPSYRIVV